MTVSLTPITANNISFFRDLLPPGAGDAADIRLGCIVRDTACAALQLRRLHGGCRITWLYAAPDYRRLGCGGLLLDTALDLTRQMASPALSVCYFPQAPWGEAMTYLLLKRGFAITVSQNSDYRLPLGLLKDHPLLAGKPSAQVYPLQAVSRQWLEDFRQRCRGRHNYLCSEADFAGSDQALSQALVIGRVVKGLLLIAPEPSGGLFIELLYIEPDHRLALPQLLQSAAREIAAAGRPDRYFRVSTQNDKIRRMIDRLFGPQEALVRKSCAAVCPLAFAQSAHDKEAFPR
jgi:GNAT superfamily N-acetyltransferase